MALEPAQPYDTASGSYRQFHLLVGQRRSVLRRERSWLFLLFDVRDGKLYFWRGNTLQGLSQGPGQGLRNWFLNEAQLLAEGVR